METEQQQKTAEMLRRFALRVNVFWTPVTKALQTTTMARGVDLKF